MSLQDVPSALAASHRIVELQAEVERLRAQLQCLRRDRADYREMLRREAGRCSNA